MNKKMTNDLGLKILSFLLAILLWVIIVNADDPTKTRTFSNIPVKILNENEITKVNKVYTVTEGDTVDITVTGKRSVVENVRSTDLVATADLSELSVMDVTYINVSCPKYAEDNLTLSLGKSKMLKVSLEEKDSNKFPVEIKQNGEVADGYYISDKTASPNMITVTGPESVIAKIQKVVVVIDVTGRTSSFSTKVQPQVYDNNGDLIDNANLEFSESEVAVNVTLVKTKEVILSITHIGEPRAGYELSEFDYEPKKIYVAGDDEALKQVSYIAYEVDITDLYEDYETTIDISDAITEAGAIPIEDNETVAVSMKFEKLQTERIDINNTDVSIRNVPSGYETEVNTKTVSVLVRGGSKEVKNLQAADLQPYIDLAGKSVGAQEVNVGFVSSDKYEILSKVTVNVTMKKKD